MKAAANLAKHKVSFEEAATVFADPLGGVRRNWRPVSALRAKWGLARISPFLRNFVPVPILPTGNLTRQDLRRSPLGLSQIRRLLAVMYAERGGAIRIISARPATRRERRNYEEITP
jgi:uncharacterized DUF497 family protein